MIKPFHLLGLFVGLPLVAQNIVPDGTTSTGVREGNIIIPTDTNSIRGTNLFHSFDRFDVPITGVTFSTGETGINGARISNIFNRVTGANPSVILGNIQSSQDFPFANFYLLNPNGILFAPNAQIDIGGTFVATTATGIGFSGGGFFTADRSGNFFAGSPLSLQFSVAQPGAIINQARLEVPTGEDIVLAGGTVVSPRTLTAPAGNVDVVAVEGNSTVTLRSPSSILGLEIRSGSLAPPWQGTITELPQLAQLLTGTPARQEALELAVNPDGSLELLPQGRSQGLRTLLLANGKFEPIGEFIVQPGDVILGSIAATDIQIVAENNLGVFVPNIQAGGSLLLQGQNNLVIRDTIDTPAIITSGSNLTLRGDRGIDILALNNPSSPVTSGGNITFRSDGSILADGFFTAQGTIGARTVTNNVTSLFSAVEFEEIQGNVRFLPLDRQQRPLSENILGHRTPDRIARTTTDPVPPPEPVPPPPPPQGDSLTSLAVQASLSSLSLVPTTPLGLAVDLLLERGKILEAQQTLDLAILGELDSYLGNVTPQANPQILTQLNPEQQQLYQEYQALVRSNDQKLAPFLARPQVQNLARQVRDANLRQLQQDLSNLDAQSAILYPVIRDDRVELILIAPGLPPLRRSSYIPRQELLKHLQDFRYSLEAVYDVEADPKKQGQILYRHLIQPLEDILESQNIRTIFYAPSAQLRYVPLNALHDGKQWLAQRFLINNITSASLQNFAPLAKATPRILAAALTQPQILSIGRQTFHFGGLPSARGEVNYLTGLIELSTKLLDQEFSPANTRQQSQSFNWLHLATHAVFLPGKPEDSFIVFGNGQHQNFRALRQWDLSNIDLVVLSACETAAGEILGNGEEILGFGYLMQERGARSTIASLWSISDGGTQAWMEIFYTLLVKQKLTKAEAMALTQRILITKDFTPLGDQAGVIEDRLLARLPQSTIENLDHPYYWAPFLLIGNGF